jgi:hypothetical protein
MTIGHGGIICGTADGNWLSAQQTGQRMQGSYTFKLYSDKAYIGQTQATKEKNPDCDSKWFGPSVSLPKSPKGTTIGIAGDWNALPRLAKPLSITSKAYVAAVRELLSQKGLGSSPVRITEVLQVDLEGDGQNEVLIRAESKNFYNPDYMKGEYEFIALRKIIGGQVKTFVLAGAFNNAEGRDYVLTHYQLMGLWDIDGDGILEILLVWACPEADSGGYAVYGLDNGEPKRVAWTIAFSY